MRSITKRGAASKNQRLTLWAVGILVGLGAPVSAAAGPMQTWAYSGYQALCCAGGDGLGGGGGCPSDVQLDVSMLQGACPGALYRVSAQTLADDGPGWDSPQCNEVVDVSLSCDDGEHWIGQTRDWNGCKKKRRSGIARFTFSLPAAACDGFVVRHRAGACTTSEKVRLQRMKLVLLALPREVCNGHDDDCDGATDEGGVCPVTPTVAIVQPGDGDVFNGASSACAPGAAGCTVEVSAAVVGIADGALATLAVECGGLLASLDTTVTGAAATWSAIPLTDQATCSLTATAASPGGSVVSAPVTVRVDRIAPVLLAFTKPADSLILPPADEDPVKPGIQKSVAVNVRGCEAYSVVTLDVEPGGAALSSVVPVDVPDDGSLSLLLGTVDFVDDGTYTLRARVVDAAGNPSELLEKPLVVNATGSIVSIVAPADVAPVACTTGADCGPGGVCAEDLCAIGFGAATVRQALIQTVAVPPGAVVRVCSDGPGAGDACATPGMHAIAATTAASLVTVDLSLAPDGVHRLIAEAEVAPGAFVSSVDTAAPEYRERRVLIDTVAPVVTGIWSPSDALPPALVLSQSEQAGPGQFAFTVTATDAGAPLAGDGVLSVDGSPRAAVTLAGGSGTVDLTFASDGAKLVGGVVTDAVGNESAPAEVSYTVKVAPLSVAFLAPHASPLLASDSLDVVVVTNQTAGTVTLFDGDTEVGALPVGGGGLASFDHLTFGTLSDGVHLLEALLEDEAGNVAAAVTSPVAIEVDTIPPDLTVVSPTAGTLTDADDAAPATGGFQVATVLSTTGAASWHVLSQSGCAPDYSGCGPAVVRASGVATDGLLPPVLVTVPVTEAVGHHVLVARATDAAGNVAEQQVFLTLELFDCVLALAGLPADGVFNAQDCATPGCATIDTTVTVQWVGPCGAIDTVTLLEDGVPVGIDTSLAGQQATFALTLGDGTVSTLSAEATQQGALVAVTGETDLLVDLTAPFVQLVSAALTGGQSPASGDVVVWGAASDGDPSTSTTLEVPLRVTVDDTLGGPARIESIVSMTDGPTHLAGPVDLPSLPAVRDFLYVPLADQQTHVVTVTASDAAGNIAQTSFTATVDLSPPEEVVLEPIGEDDVLPRLPAIALRWLPPASNTGIAGGPAASYDVRYARAPIVNDESFAAACTVDDLPFADPVPVPGDPSGGIADALVVRGPDPRSVNSGACKLAVGTGTGLWFAVRAMDSAGNVSPVTGAGTAATHAARLRYARITHSLSSPMGAETRLEDRVYRVGDVNGDGFDDVALGGQAMSGFCLVFGRDGGGAPLEDIDLSASEGDGWQCILDAAPTGAGSPVVSAGDMNGDGAMDIAVGVGDKSQDPGYPEEVRVYLGVLGGGPIGATPALVIHGTHNNNLFGYRTLASAGNFNGDASATSGLPLDDLVIPSGVGNAVYIVPGSAALVAGSTVVIDLANAANRAAWKVVTVQMVGAAGNAYFGWATGGMGDVLPDAVGSFDEVVVAQAKDPAQVVVLRGRAVDGDTTILLSGAGDGAQTGDAKTVRLRPELGLGTNTFGADLGTGFDLDGGGLPDLLANHQYASATVGRFYLFRGESLAAHEGGVMQVEPTSPSTPDGAIAGVNGVMFTQQRNLVLPLGDFDGPAPGQPSTVDIASTTYSFSSFGELTIRLNHAGGAAGGVEGLLPTDDIVVRDPYGSPPSGQFGATWAPVGDFDGDGAPDLVVGTAGQGWAVLVY